MKARTNLLARLALATAVSVGLAACGGSSDNDGDTDMMDDGPTLEQRQTSQQAAITTAASGVTTALTGLNSTSPTQGQVDALDAAIAALDAAIKAAEDLSDSAKSAASGTLTFAQSAAATAKANTAAAAKVGRIATQKGAIATASNRVTTARNALSSPVPTQAEVKALNDAITALQAAIDGADDVADDDADLVAANTNIGSAGTAAGTAQSRINTARDTQAAAIQKEANRLTAAREDLEDAGDEPTDDLVARLRAAIDRLQGAVDAATTDSAGRWSADEDAIKTATAAIREANAEHTVADASVKGAESTAKAAEVKRHEDAITAATGRVTSARSALSDPPTQDQITALDNAIKGLETAISNAQSVSTDLAAVLSAAGELVDSAKSVLMTAKKDREAEVVADRKKKNEAPMKVAEAINDHDLGATTPNEFGDATISRTSGDAVIKLNQPGDEKDDKPYTSSDAPSAGSGWMGKTFVHTDDEARRPFTERGTIYTDIKKADDADWVAVNFNGGDNTNFVDPNAGGDVTLGSTVTVDASDITGGKVVPGKPNTDTGTGSLTIAAGSSERGTLFGQPGLFRCATGACTITRGNVDDEKPDRLSFGGGTLTFDPDSGDPKVKYGDPDGDYTRFGYWMKSTTQRDGTIEHDIRTFASGSGYVTGPQATTDGSTGDLHVVRGTANYYGVAAGVYVKKDGTGDALEVTNGEFTADATLKASFGGPDIAANDHFSISGTISGFADGSTNLGFSPLTLEKVGFGNGTNVGSVAPDAESGAATTDAVGWAFSGGKTDGGGATGDWSGQFFGDVGGETNDADEAEDQYDDYPANVSGEFNGHFTNGHVAGAFGASYDE